MTGGQRMHADAVQRGLRLLVCHLETIERRKRHQGAVVAVVERHEGVREATGAPNGTVVVRR